MSYWVSLHIDTGNPNGSIEVVEIGNYTSNVSPMWALALGESLKELDGRSAGESVSQLEAAVAHMEHPNHRETYESMNPKNGWGNHQSATQYLAELRDACKLHPKCIIHVSN